MNVVQDAIMQEEGQRMIDTGAQPTEVSPINPIKTRKEAVAEQRFERGLKKGKKNKKGKVQDEARD